MPLLEAKKNRSVVEYYWTLTPIIIKRILERYPFIDFLTYLDADLFFYSSPDPIMNELGTNSVLIHEHRFPPEQAFLQKYGKYNVGLLCFRHDTNGLEILNWWGERCIEWCYARLENGKYGDQLYLDHWPETFNGVVVLKNIGAGVAPWNHIQYTIGQDETGNISVNDVPLVFYHFHSLTFVEPNILIPSIYTTNPLTLDLLKYCFVPYANKLHESINQVREIIPDFRFGLFRDQVLNEKHTFIASHSQFVRIKNSNLPHPVIPLNDTWDCYSSEQLRDLSEVNEQALPHNIAADRANESWNHNYKNTLSYAKSEFNSGNKITAISVMRNVVEKWPDKSQAHITLGEMLWLEGDQKDAVEHLSRAYEIEPGDPDIVSKLIIMLIQTNEYHKAQNIVAESLGKTADFPNARSNL
ncbi:MAG: tetratricopeptide repeat protein [Desulfobacterales bacterium]|jgi:tetratricopeptide (TPR) repeat protein